MSILQVEIESLGRQEALATAAEAVAEVKASASVAAAARQELRASRAAEAHLQDELAAVQVSQRWPQTLCRPPGCFDPLLRSRTSGKRAISSRR